MLPAIRSCICSRRYADDAGGCETGGGDAFWEGGLISFSGPGVRAVGGGLARNIASKSAFGVGVAVGVGWGVEGGVTVTPTPNADLLAMFRASPPPTDRKSTRLNSSHEWIS